MRTADLRSQPGILSRLLMVFAGSVVIESNDTEDSTPIQGVDCSRAQGGWGSRTEYLNATEEYAKIETPSLDTLTLANSSSLPCSDSYSGIANMSVRRSAVAVALALSAAAPAASAPTMECVSSIHATPGR